MSRAEYPMYCRVREWLSTQEKIWFILRLLSLGFPYTSLMVLYKWSTLKKERKSATANRENLRKRGLCIMWRLALYPLWGLLGCVPTGDGMNQMANGSKQPCNLNIPIKTRKRTKLRIMVCCGNAFDLTCNIWRPLRNTTETKSCPAVKHRRRLTMRDNYNSVCTDEA